MTSSLPNAIRTAIAKQVGLADISVPAWSRTYGVSSEHVRIVWEAILSEVSRKPQNQYDEAGEGK